MNRVGDEWMDGRMPRLLRWTTKIKWYRLNHRFGAAVSIWPYIERHLVVIGHRKPS
jgi:hypothetical protein